MDRLEFAIRRYQQIVSHPLRTWEEFPTRVVRVWLADDVCPVVDAYRKRPAFKDHATWPIRVLVPGAESPERRRIEAVDNGLVQAARALLGIARQKRVHRHLLDLNPPTESVAAQTVELTGTAVASSSVKRAVVDNLPVEIHQIERIAQRFWSDLVSAQDYFDPSSGWMSRNPPERQAGDFVVALNPELHPIGDFVTRALLRRVEGLLDSLARFRGACLQAAKKTNSTRSARFDEERQVWQSLAADVTALQSSCMNRWDVPVRDSCVILTQTYTAFHRAPDLTWLDLPAGVIEFGVGLLRHRLTHARNPEMIERIATALGDLRNLYDGDTPLQAAVEEAIASGGLVLVESSRDVYWEGKRVEKAWHRRPVLWRLLWELADKAIRRAAVKEDHLYPYSGAPSKFATNMSRLTDLLPQTLMLLISSVHGKRSYRLQLESNRIHLFQ